MSESSEREFIARAVPLLERLLATAFTRDATGHPVCPCCTFQSQAFLRQQPATERGYPVYTFEIRAHHNTTCDLMLLYEAGKALLNHDESQTEETKP